MKRCLIAGALLCLAGAASAVPVEFNVPVEVRNITEAATHVVVTCGSWDPSPGSRRFLWPASVEVPLQQGANHKFFSGVVKVTVPFSGNVAPTGPYRCTMGLRGRLDSGEFSYQPAAPGSRAVTEVIGDFSELKVQENRSAVARPPLAPLPPLQKTPPTITHK